MGLVDFEHALPDLLRSGREGDQLFRNRHVELFPCNRMIAGRPRHFPRGLAAKSEMPFFVRALSKFRKRELDGFMFSGPRLQSWDFSTLFNLAINGEFPGKIEPREIGKILAIMNSKFPSA